MTLKQRLILVGLGAVVVSSVSFAIADKKPIISGVDIQPAVITDPNFDPATITPVFTELSRENIGDSTVNTTVEFTFDINGQEVKKTVTISHFSPQSEADIKIGIYNRYMSELRNLLTAQ